MTMHASVTSGLGEKIAQSIHAQGGWIGFDDFMAQALYTPQSGYYARQTQKFGWMAPGSGRLSGGDFVTAPELSPLFGRTLARQVAEALTQTDTDCVWEFGAGTGQMALQILQGLQALGHALPRYRVVELSAALRALQQKTLAAFVDHVDWVESLPERMQGVVLGNELIDAMPVKLLNRVDGVWHERGVSLGVPDPSSRAPLVWQDRPTALRPPVAVAGEHDYLTEIHEQGEAFVRTLGEKLLKGAVFLIDYGFPEAQYYHPQRHMGTLMCHHLHRADTDPLSLVGEKDITAHVNFTGLALAGQEVGLEVLGYCNQAHFLINCGFAQELSQLDQAGRVMAQRLIMEHEMGELFKCMAWVKGPAWHAMGFSHGDKTHTL